MIFVHVQYVKFLINLFYLKKNVMDTNSNSNIWDPKLHYFWLRNYKNLYANHVTSVHLYQLSVQATIYETKEE